MPFIIANKAFEKVASYGLEPNMKLNLISDYKISVAKGTCILFLWTAAFNFTLVLVAFLLDSYLQVDDVADLEDRRELNQIFEVFMGQLRQLFGLKSTGFYKGASGSSILLASERGFTE